MYLRLSKYLSIFLSRSVYVPAASMHVFVDVFKVPSNYHLDVSFSFSADLILCLSVFRMLMPTMTSHAFKCKPPARVHRNSYLDTPNPLIDSDTQIPHRSEIPCPSEGQSDLVRHLVLVRLGSYRRRSLLQKASLQVRS